MAEILKDSITVETSTSALTRIKSNQFIESEEKTINTADGKLRWSFRVTGAGGNGRCDVILRVVGFPVIVCGTIDVGPKDQLTYSSFDNNFFDKPAEMTIKSINPGRIGDDNGFIGVSVNFDPIAQPNIQSPSLSELFNYLLQREPDASIILDDGCVKVHRGLISMLSPIFQSMFNNDSKNTVVIHGFNLSTVESTVNLCYGRDIGKKSMEDAIEMLKFSDKFAIEVAMKKIEQFIETNLQVCNFCTIAEFAWSFGMKNLQKKCAKFFRKHHNYLTFAPDFMNLTADFKERILRAAGDVTTVELVAEVSPNSNAAQLTKAFEKAKLNDHLKNAAVQTDTDEPPKNTIKTIKIEPVDNSLQLSAECSGKRCLGSFHGTYLRAYLWTGRVDMVSKAQAWEHWFVEDWKGKVIFKCIHGDYYLRALPDGDFNLSSNTQGWEQFVPFKNDDGSWSFRSFHGQWIRADVNGSLNTAPENGIWEHFWLESWD